MKEKKNLERAIVLGLILSTGVYGSAWAAEVGPIHNANYNNDSNHGSPYNEDVNVTSDNIGNIILEDDRQYTVTITTTGEGNDINLTTDGVGIQLADKIEAGTKVTLSADGDIIINAKKDGIQGNASVRYENNVSTITLNAQNNRITATETAVYGLGKVDIELTADKDNVIVATGNDYAVKTDANSAGILNITAQDGNNIIMAEKGTAIRANGNKVITIKVNNKDNEENGNNIIIGGENGIQHNEEGDVGEGETLVKDANTKYVIIDAKTGSFIEWEGGDNRVLPVTGVAKNDVLVISDSPLRVQENKWKGAGVVIPVFSLRSEGSCGVGDFGDLSKMVDWAALTKMRVIQILPVYDTTIHHNWLDSYPYNSISIYALHPQYMDLRQLPVIQNKEFLEGFEEERQRLNALPQVDYEAVQDLKEQYIKCAFWQEKEQVLASDDFITFYKQNEDWLMPYAAFSVLRDRYGTADFSTWPEYQTFKADEIYAFCKPSSPYYNDVAYYYYIQYYLHKQLLSACNYARSKGIILKGDIPIGISRYSVEAWVEPYYFNLNAQAGAPPDAFSVNGQNWGFPTYNWKNMQKDNCQWWVRRFRKMAEYFDAYRIDHVLGFFRIWEIPEDAVHGLLGQFSPALPMTVDEIESYGLRFRKKYFTRPYISDWVLDEIFGERAEEVKNTYLNARGYDWYEMKPEYETQKKVQQAFEGCESSEDIALREGL